MSSISAAIFTILRHATELGNKSLSEQQTQLPQSQEHFLWIHKPKKTVGSLKQFNKKQTHAWADTGVEIKRHRSSKKTTGLRKASSIKRSFTVYPSSFKTRNVWLAHTSMQKQKSHTRFDTYSTGVRVKFHYGAGYNNISCYDVLLEAYLCNK